jgi:hypothetical protein
MTENEAEGGYPRLVEPLPMTVVAPLAERYTIATVIGTGSDKKSYQPKNVVPNSYWFLAINRWTLKAEYNQVQTSNDDPPQGIAPYDTTDYMLVVATYALGSDNLPQGPLYEFLIDNGANRQLRQLEQIYSALSCGTFGSMAYALVGVLGPGASALPGIESSSIVQAENPGTVLTCTLIGTEINGKVIYSPTMQ